MRSTTGLCTLLLSLPLAGCGGSDGGGSGADASAIADATPQDASSDPADAAGEPDAADLCGDGVVQPDEQCDDANDDDGDGCTSECEVNHECVVTHNGGSPATLSSLRLTPEGAVPTLHRITLDGDDGEGTPSERDEPTLTACGRHVYAVLRGAESITHARVGFDGSLAAGDNTAVAGVVGAVCDPDRNVLVAISPVEESPTVELTSFAVDEDTGELGEADSETLDFDGGETMMSAFAARNPATGDLWVIGYKLAGATPSSAAFRVALGADGSLSAEEGPVDIGSASLGLGIAMRGDGERLLMAGFAGGCTGAWVLPAGGELPSSDDLIAECGGEFGSGRRIAPIGQSDTYVESTGDGELRIAEIDVEDDSLVHLATEELGSGELFPVPAYGGEALVVIDAADGALSAHLVGDDPTDLTAGDALTLDVGTFRGALTLPCGP